MQAVLAPHPPSSLHTYLHHDYHLPHAYSIHNTCIMIRSHALEILIIIPQILPVLSIHTMEHPNHYLHRVYYESKTSSTSPPI